MAIDHCAHLAALPEPGLLIGDQWLTAASGEPLLVEDPSNGQKLVETPTAGRLEVDWAMEAAVAAGRGWAGLREAKRRTLLLRLADLIQENAQRFALVGALEQGLTTSVSYARFAAEWFRYYAGWTDKLTGEVNTGYSTYALSYTVHEPYGVVVVITPFNVSLGAIGMKVAPALAAGNAVVLKPPETTPLQSLLFGQLCLEAGIPPGVVNVLPGGAAVGEGLVSHRDAGKISFTGSLPTARAILRSAAEHVTPVITELGGKSANLAFADGDWRAAVRLSTMNACVNLSGQGCMFPTRLLVESSVEEQAVQYAVELLADVRAGDPVDPATQLGPLISEAALARTLSYVGRAGDQARLRNGGERLGGELADGYFMAPTVYDRVDPASPVGQEEIFGPVLAVMSFGDEDEAVEIANAVDTGLAAYVYTDNLRRAHRLARRLDVGTVGVNAMTTVPPTYPFGGNKRSGSGREGGYAGLQEFLHAKTVHVPLEERYR
jgi:aldehyde dehydrogenase (NAD+)